MPLAPVRVTIFDSAVDHMCKRSLFGFCGLVVASLGYCASLEDTASEPRAATVVSPAQQRVIDANIASLRSPSDRAVARGWSRAKQVAEFICRPKAQPAFEGKLKGVDRVFLGTSEPDTLSLIRNDKLIGTGQARYDAGWRKFSFECLMDPKTAEVTKFLISIQAMPSV